MCKALERAGWLLKKITISHSIYDRPSSRVNVSVPVHGDDVGVHVVRRVGDLSVVVAK
jgi:predicted RNA binding protein YcfA (HicA-like mRNA interferase family)